MIGSGFSLKFGLCNLVKVAIKLSSSLVAACVPRTITRKYVSDSGSGLLTVNNVWVSTIAVRMSSTELQKSQD